MESDPLNRWMIAASGDLAGWGEWPLKQIGLKAEARYDWHITADKPILRLLLPVLAPVFAWNHHWAMAKTEAGLQRELVRRRRAAVKESSENS